MVREQMVCIVSERYERSSVLSPEEKNALDAAFTRIGRIHFAALALLPPRPGMQAPPSLLLELAVDDGLSHAELVDLLEQQGFDALWPVYGSFWKGGDQSSERTRRDWLHGHLLDNLQGAHGGFVGARDRSVGQIHAEARLYQAARGWIGANPPAVGADRASVARELADWAAREGEFRWAVEPPRRSFWRSRWMTTPLRVFLALACLGLPLVAVTVVLLTLLAFAGVLAVAAFLPLIDWTELIRSPAVFGEYAAWGPSAVRTACILAIAIALIAFVGVSGIRSSTVTAFLLLVFGALLTVAIAIMTFRYGATFLGFLGATEVLLRAGVLATLGFMLAWVLVALAMGAALLFVPPFLGLGAVLATGIVSGVIGALTIHWLLGALVAYGAASNDGLYPALHDQWLFGLPAIDAIVLIVFVGFSVIGYALSRFVKLPPFTTYLVANAMNRVRPPVAPLIAGHQVHKSLDECEGELALGGRVNHMFSLTELREPVWWNRWLLRFFLRMVTYVGHTVFTEGKLATAEGIRFGHWHVIDGGRRLLFCSNFDGAFGGYLDEFINGASEGVNLFWRWTELRRRLAAADGHPAVKHDRIFPPTRLLVFGGCKHEQWFKTYARDSMLPHIYRFEAYRFTAQDVERATRLREALFGPRNPVSDDQIMRALES